MSGLEEAVDCIVPIPLLTQEKDNVAFIVNPDSNGILTSFSENGVPENGVFQCMTQPGLQQLAPRQSAGLYAMPLQTSVFSRTDTHATAFPQPHPETDCLYQ